LVLPQNVLVFGRHLMFSIPLVQSNTTTELRPKKPIKSECNFLKFATVRKFVFATARMFVSATAGVLVFAVKTRI